jgi:hypothetical protein
MKFRLNYNYKLLLFINKFIKEKKNRNERKILQLIQ